MYVWLGLGGEAAFSGKKGKIRFYVVLVTDELDIQKPRINASRGGNCWGEMLFIQLMDQ